MPKNREATRSVKKATRAFKSRASSDTKTKRNVAKAQRGRKKGRGSF